MGCRLAAPSSGILRAAEDCTWLTFLRDVLGVIRNCTGRVVEVSQGIGREHVLSLSQHRPQFIVTLAGTDITGQLADARPHDDLRPLRGCDRSRLSREGVLSNQLHRRFPIWLARFPTPMETAFVFHGASYYSFENGFRSGIFRRPLGLMNQIQVSLREPLAFLLLSLRRRFIVREM